MKELLFIIIVLQIVIIWLLLREHDHIVNLLINSDDEPEGERKDV